jgi:hypothetical protein
MRKGPSEPDNEAMTKHVDALEAAYADLRGLILGLDEARSWRPTGCAGWAVRDLVQHLLGDAQRALVALATPARRPAHQTADRDAVTYWTDSPGAPDADSRGIRATRTMASQWRLEYLTATYAETTAAVATLARCTDADALVVTQGHVLRVDDLLATLVVEAAVHHLDLVLDLDDPGPGPAALAVTRATLDGLLGYPAPAEWPDAGWIRAATGRGPVTDAHRHFLGPGVERLPLLR